ncbi:MAG TPA: MBL fold metallo-hydrolase [Candidatus Nanoarchaeia archaeon]|nr:MBL fold metallo-hydrolase [Candidatus Nanoarchaeia archaeon]
MRITIFGTRGSIPVSGPQYLTYGGETSCVSVSADSGKTFILDAGNGIRRLNSVGDKELYLLLTHLHWDHIQGLPFFKPTYDPQRRITVYGKANGISVRTALENQHERVNFPVPFSALEGIKDIYEFQPGEEIYDDGELCIDTLLQNHPSGGSVGYRFRERFGEGKMTTFVFSTDYEPEHNWLDDKVAEFWAGADLVIADMHYEPERAEDSGDLAYSADSANQADQLSPEEEAVSFKKGWGHSDYKTGLRLATLAEVQRIVGTHFAPESTDNYLSRLESRMEEEAGRIAEKLGKKKVEAKLAKPGQTYILPSESLVLPDLSGMENMLPVE